MITVGIDEVGRGCWAGPLVAGAVILHHKSSKSRTRSWKLGDSKVLTRQQRESADVEIRSCAMAWGLGWVQPTEIDTLGLTASVRLAFERAIGLLAFDYDELIIDGNFNFFPQDARARAVVKADASVPAVSAASIIAKV